MFDLVAAVKASSVVNPLNYRRDHGGILRWLAPEVGGDTLCRRAGRAGLRR